MIVLYIYEIRFRHKADRADVVEFLLSLDKSEVREGDILYYSDYNKDAEFDLEVIGIKGVMFQLLTIDR